MKNLKTVALALTLGFAPLTAMAENESRAEVATVVDGSSPKTDRTVHEDATVFTPKNMRFVLMTVAATVAVVSTVAAIYHYKDIANYFGFGKKAAGDAGKVEVKAAVEVNVDADKAEEGKKEKEEGKGKKKKK